MPDRELSSSKLKKRRESNRLYCLKYRLRKATTTHNRPADLAKEQLPTQSNGVSSTSSSGEVRAATRSSTSTRLFVRLPPLVRSPSNTRRQNALKKARNKVHALKQKLKTEERKTRRLQKRFQRLTRTGSQRSSTSAPVEKTELTPKSKTRRDLKGAGVISGKIIKKSTVSRLSLTQCPGHRFVDAEHIGAYLQEAYRCTTQKTTCHKNTDG